MPHSKPTIEQDDWKAVVQVLKSGNITQGAKVKQFEHKIAALEGLRYGTACSSGTTALHLALIGLGIGSGDEVIVPSYVCSSPFLAVLHAGATPRIADIEPSGFNISGQTAKKHLSSRTKAIIVPHMFGNPAELTKILDLEVPVIEDCAQALGAEYSNRKVGSFGELSVLSFYATKMITTGEGGMVLTNNGECYSRIIEARDYDKKPLTSPRYNYKMTDFQAALGLSQLNKLPQFINRRRQIASIYSDEFARYKISLPRANYNSSQVFFRYVILTEKEELIQKEARKGGVTCEKPIWKPLHKELPDVKCPNTDYAQAHALSIPIYPSLREEEIEHVTRSLRAAFKKHLSS